MRRVGILGGTFDPIHQGHLDLGQAAQRSLALTEILVIPSNIPPHRPQPVASSWHRFAMVALAIVGRSGWRASDIELTAAGPSFSSATLQRLHQAGYEPGELFFLTGADAFAEIESWKDYPALLDRAHFAVVSRPGFAVSALASRLPTLADRMRLVDGGSADGRAGAAATSIFLIDASTADVSATAIRTSAASRRPVAGLVPELVERYIEQHQLYAGQPPSPSASAGHDHGSTPAGRLHG